MWFIKELFAGLVLCWKDWRTSTPRWLAKPGEVPPEARALMLGAVGGVSGPLRSVEQARAEAKKDEKDGSLDDSAE